MLAVNISQILGDLDGRSLQVDTIVVEAVVSATNSAHRQVSWRWVFYLGATLTSLVFRFPIVSIALVDLHERGS